MFFVFFHLNRRHISTKYSANKEDDIMYACYFASFLSLSAPLGLLLRSYAAQGYRVASMAKGAALLLIQCPLLIRTGILNSAMVPAIDSSSTLHEGHHGIVNFHQLTLADGTPV